MLFTWYALLRRRIGPAALAIGGLLWLALFGLVLTAFMSGGSYLAALPALFGALGCIAALSLRGWWAVLALVVGAAVGVVILVPTVALLFPALGMAMGGAAALFAVWLGLAALPLVDLLFPEAGGQRGLDALHAQRWGALPGLAALVAAVVLVGTAFAVDRFDARHPIPTQLMYALDAGTGQAWWLSEESTLQDWTSSYVDSRAPVSDEFPALGGDEVWRGPAEAASLLPPAMEVLSDMTGADGARTVRLRVKPQRNPVRLMSLHVDASSTAVQRAVVAGLPVSAADGAVGDDWSFGMVFHAPPPEGVEVELVLRPGRRWHRPGAGAGHGRQRRAGRPAGLPAPPGRRRYRRVAHLRAGGGGADVHAVSRRSRVWFPGSGVPVRGDRGRRRCPGRPRTRRSRPAASSS